MSAILSCRADPERFRTAVREWLHATVPADWTQQMTGASTHEYARFQRWWFGELGKAGLATAHWPKEWGGENLPLRQQRIIYEEIARANAPRPAMYVFSQYHVPATLFAWGSAAQIERYIPGCRDGSETWCQGFSEPNAGSDLASLRTRAQRVGDAYIVNGQKIWTSDGHHAKYCLLLARTDPQAPKHQGISYFILDMQSPGVRLRQIRQANGNAEFCETFLDDVAIPAENLIGRENEGWKIAQSTLSAERGLIIFELSERLHYAFDELLAKVRSGTAHWHADDQLRREFMQAYTDIQALRQLVKRMLDELENTGQMSATPVYVKVWFAELLQRCADLTVRAGGLASHFLRAGLHGGNDLTGNPVYDYLTSWSWTIAGGSNEIMKNIIAERHLGLPR